MLKELTRIPILLDEHPEVRGNHYLGSYKLRGAGGVKRVHITEGSIDAGQENVRTEIDCDLEFLGAMSGVPGVIDSDTREIQHDAQSVWSEVAMISIDRVHGCLTVTIGASFFE